MLLLTLLACGPDIASLYAEERKHALAVASTAPTSWKPDMIVSAGNTAVEGLLLAHLQGALDDIVPEAGSGVPMPNLDLHAREVALSASEECPSCLQIRIVIEGSVSASLLGARASLPVEGTVKGQVELGFDEKKVVVRVRKLKNVELQAREFGKLGLGSADSLFEGPVRDALLSALPPIPVVDLGAANLPILFLRVKTHPHGLRVEALTNVPDSTPAQLEDVRGVELRLGISESALTGLVRRAAFERGLIPEVEVGIDPRRLDVSADHFTLDLRLWRIAGAGWWRDYVATGTLNVADGKLHLDVPRGSVLETAASPGAGLADPLAALFQSEVLKAITTNLDQTFPAAVGSKNGGLRARAVATAVRGEADTLVVEGELRTAGDSR